MTEERIREIFWKVTDNRGDFIDFARALLSASIADTAGAKPFTAVFLNVTRDEAREITEHPKWSAGSWGHALDERDAARAAIAAPPAPSVADIEDPVIAPRDLLIAACSAIDKKRNAPNTLAALRAITMAPRSAPSVADAAGASAKMEFKPVGSNEHIIVHGTPEVIDALKERLTHDYRLAAGASEGQAEEFPEVEQDWAQVEPSVAFHLIERHAENWAHAGHLMEAWRTATTSAEIAALRERIAGMEKDAERYRHIRATTRAIRDDHGENRTEVTPEQFDEAIDAAIAKEPK